MRFFRPFPLTAIIFPSAVFRIKTPGKAVCLTFDDGPSPASTPAILEILDKFSIKAVFFCSGESARENPDLMNRIRDAGHLTGNHGYRHLDGWKTPAAAYIENVNAARELTSDKYFRPPYGHLSFRQYRKLSRTYRIILWDLMVYDFDPGLAAEESLAILNSRLRPGSVIVLHDSPQSSCTVWLESFITGSSAKGFRFELL